MCELMRTHQNFTVGMLVEDVQPVKDALLYCMGARYCRASEAELDSGDSTETELAELGDMLVDIISVQPSAGIFDKAVMQGVITSYRMFCQKTRVLPVLLLRRAAHPTAREHRHASALLHRQGLLERRCVVADGDSHPVLHVFQGGGGGPDVH
jgi:hypothetical protein